jgi:hypothetical protein
MTVGGKVTSPDGRAQFWCAPALLSCIQLCVHAFMTSSSRGNRRFAMTFEQKVEGVHKQRVLRAAA